VKSSSNLCLGRVSHNVALRPGHEPATIADAGSYVGIEYPVHLLPLDGHRQRVQRLMRPAPLPKPIREAFEVQTVVEANQFLGDHYIAEFNASFKVAAAEPGTAFVPNARLDLDRNFCRAT